MEEITAKLMEHLHVHTVFTIPIFGGIGISESVVMTWGIMVFIWGVSVFLTWDMRLHNPSKRQRAAEMLVISLNKIFDNILGEHGREYRPYLQSVLIYLALANVCGLVGFIPPTRDLNVAAALSIMSIVLIEYAAIKKKGMRGWVKSFSQPMPIVTPINILEVFIKPLSLCMRLFGNILGAYVIMELLKTVLPVVIPVPFSFYFDVFDGLIQAYVFVFLTSLFIKEAVE